MANAFNKINWQAFSAHERNNGIEALKTVISKNGGYIINFNLFSDLALSLVIEIEEKNILNLYQEIKKSMNIKEPKPDNLDNNSKKDWWILMNVSFLKGNGDLKTEIPDVPG